MTKSALSKVCSRRVSGSIWDIIDSSLSFSNDAGRVSIFAGVPPGEIEGEASIMSAVYTKSVEAFCKQFLSSNPWFKKWSLGTGAGNCSKRKAKTEAGLEGWPTTFPDILKECNGDQPSVGNAISETAVSFACQVWSRIGNGHREYLELESLPSVVGLGLGLKRQAFKQLMKSPIGNNAIKLLPKRVDAAREYVDALADANAKAREVVAQNVSACLKLEDDFIKEKVGAFYSCAAKALEESADAALLLMESDTLKFDSEIGAAQLPVDAVSTKVNSSEARDLKTKWTPLVNGHQVLIDEIQKLDCAKYEVVPLRDIESEFDLEKVEQKYNTVRNKICEIMALRALCRPVPPNQSRRSLVEKTSADIAQLEGELEAKIDMLLKEAPED